MEVKLAKNYGFCFGVKRAIKIAEQNKNNVILGSLIHNQKEIMRLEKDFGVRVEDNIENIKDDQSVIVRTHGIPKNDLEYLKNRNINVTDATCPYVTKPQQIVDKMGREGYQVIIYGDIDHPEVKGVMSYCDECNVVGNLEELKNIKINKKVALVSQTTKRVDNFFEIALFLMNKTYEIRVFNTICNATFENQKATADLSKEVDIMIVVGGLTSSNTRQLLSIAKQNCPDSYLIEDESGMEMAWFGGKKCCGITAGASTPDWIIQKVKEKILQI